MVNENITSETPQPVVPAPPEPGVKLAYKPISSWAIGGIIVGALVAVLVLGSVALTVIGGEPVFLPSWAVGFLAVSGTLVSFIAMRQIAGSDGTLSGTKLAGLGMWLSVLTGIGFFVFTLSTNMALQSQANEFVMHISADDEGKRVPDTGFLPRLLDGLTKDPVQFNCAFLLTIPKRGGIDPKDENSMKVFDTTGPKDKPGTQTKLAQFRSNPLVSFLRDTLASVADRDMVKIEPLGASCGYAPPEGGKGRGSYVVVRNYRVVTPELVCVFSLDARSIEPSGPGERRKWFLAPPQEQKEYHSPTPVGKGLFGLRGTVYSFLAQWKAAGNVNFSKIDNTKWDEFLPAKQLREHVRLKLAEIDSHPEEIMIKPLSPLEITPWKAVDGKIQIRYPVGIVIPPSSSFANKYIMEGFITVESADSVDPAAFFAGTPAPKWTMLSLQWFRLVQIDPQAKLK